MNPIKHNFIVVKFGDNDFGYLIKKALLEGVSEFGLDKEACPIIWKKFIIVCIISEQLKKDAKYGGEIDLYLQYKCCYLNDKLRVTFEVNPPTEDHDGGSAAIDLNRNYAWTF